MQLKNVLKHLWKYKEVYQVNIDIIKNFINKCGDITEVDKIISGGNYNKFNYFMVIHKWYK